MDNTQTPPSQVTPTQAPPNPGAPADQLQPQTAPTTTTTTTTTAAPAQGSNPSQPQDGSQNSQPQDGSQPQSQPGQGQDQTIQPVKADVQVNDTPFYDAAKGLSTDQPYNRGGDLPEKQGMDFSGFYKPVPPELQPAHTTNWLAKTLIGERYKTTYDPDTGEKTVTKVQPGRKDIAMAIALEAISGALSGLAQKGPAAMGKAGLAGLQQGQQIGQQRQEAQRYDDQQSEKEAQLKMTAVNNAYHRRSLQIAMGKASAEENEANIARNAPRAEQARKGKAVIAADVSANDAKDVNKFPLTYTRIPISWDYRKDDKGNIVYQDALTGKIVPEGTQGAIPAVDNRYMIADIHDEPLTDEKTGENLPWVQDLVDQGKLHLDETGKLPKGTTIKNVEAEQYRLWSDQLKHSEAQANMIRQENGLEPIDINKLVREDPSLADGLIKFTANIGNTGDYLEAHKALAATDPSLAGDIAQIYGNKDGALDIYNKLHDRAVRINKENFIRANGFKNSAEVLEEANNPGASDDIRKMAQAEQSKIQNDKVAVAAAQGGATAWSRLGAEERLAKYKADVQAGKGMFGPEPDGSPNQDVEDAVQDIWMARGAPSDLSKGFGQAAQAFSRAVRKRYDELHPNSPGVSTVEQWNKDAQKPNITNGLRAAGTLFGMNGEDGTLDTAEKLILKLKNGNYPTVNTFVNRARYLEGQSLLAQINTLTADIPTELSSFMGASSGHQTDQTIRTAGHQIDTSLNLQGRLDNIKLVRKLAGERQRGIIGNNGILRNTFSQLNDPETHAPIGRYVPKDLAPVVDRHPDTTTLPVTVQQIQADKAAQQNQAPQAAPKVDPNLSKIPKGIGAIPGRDAQGNVVGYSVPGKGWVPLQ